MRGFVDGWWHANDVETAAEELSRGLADLGLDAVTAGELASAMAGFVPRAAHGRLAPSSDDLDEDEDDLRRHQLGWAARRANLALVVGGREERVRAFATGAQERDEPAWFVIASQHAELTTKLGAPTGIEALWDDATCADPLAACAGAPRELPHDADRAMRLVKHAMAGRDHAIAAAAARIAATESDHGLLGYLAWIDALRAGGRRDDARQAWIETAQNWLGGRRVWRSQWERLVKLHAQLAMTDDELVARCRAQLAAATS